MRVVVRIAGELIVSKRLVVLSVMVAVAGCQTPPAPSSTGDLVSLAKQEREVTVIALPHDWCGYGAIVDGFKAKYGLTVNELNRDASSSEELDAIRTTRGDTGPQAPDVVDIAVSFGPAAKKEGLLQPYKVSNWASIPGNAKDAEGYWYADYFGVISFEVNADLVQTPPKDWPDLLKPDFRKEVALAGDPRTSYEGLAAVSAAGLSRGNADAVAAGEAGLKFFAELKNKGNFVPVAGRARSVASGATPILLRWDYNALQDRETVQGDTEIKVIVPVSRTVAAFYEQAISAYAPHPNAAKLWMEYLYSDEGQLGFLRGFCHPIRFNELVEESKIPSGLSAQLPPAELYKKTVFLTPADRDAWKETISSQWASTVGMDVR
jgi:putative spermidine/putrescine transport system substrate-binding protein